MRPLPLRARFSLVLVALLIATFTAIALVIIRQTTQTLRVTLVNQAKTFAQLATQPIGEAYVQYNQSGTIRIKQQIDSFIGQDAAVVQVAVISADGKPLFRYNSQPLQGVTGANASAVTTGYHYDADGKLTTVIAPYVESYGLHRYTIVYGISYKLVDQDVHEIVTLIVTLSAAILLVSLVLWYMLINRLFLGPVARISRDALLISQGDVNLQVNSTRHDEIGDLARAVDTMASSLKGDIAKLEALDKTKSEFMMIASHNLRTPLTVLQGYLEEMTSVTSPDEVQRMLKPIAANVQRLQGFAEEMLVISGLEAGKGKLNREPMAIEPLIRRAAEEFQKLADEKKLKFIVSVTTNAMVDIDHSHFHAALWSILENAQKFTPENGTVELTVVEVGQKLGVAVTDTGIGIDESEIPKLFTKFHRATDTLQYDYEGMGVGLYLTKLVMQLHGGDVTVQSVKGRGTTFTLWLPMLSRRTAP